MSSVGGRKGTIEMTQAEISSITAIVVTNDCDSSAKYQVFSYIFTAGSGSTITVTTGNNNSLTAEMKAAMLRVKSGEKIFIDNIKVKFPNGSLKSARGITSKVK